MINVDMSAEPTDAEKHRARELVARRCRLSGFSLDAEFQLLDAMGLM